MAINLFSIGPLTVHGYGLMIGLGFFISIMLGCYIAKKYGLSDDHLVNLAICVLVIGFAGGKLLYVIVNFKRFLEAPLKVLGSEGFVVYGGIIIAVITMVIYCRIKKIQALKYMDLICTIAALNQAFGRLGCFMAGCCYGRRTDSAFGVIFPEGCLAPAGVRLIPTQLIMAAGDFLIFAVLLFLFTKKHLKPGIILGCYLMMYSVGRFLIEFLRDDAERGFVGKLSTSQFIAIWILIAAVAYTVIIAKFVKTESKTEEVIAETVETKETTETSEV